MLRDNLFKIAKDEKYLMYQLNAPLYAPHSSWEDGSLFWRRWEPLPHLPEECPEGRGGVVFCSRTPLQDYFTCKQ